MKKIVSIILALVMCFFAVAALASCGESAYDIAVKNGFKGTEEQWLQSLKGDAGAKGEDAAAPTIEIDKDGYWVINGVKTDVKATGDAGDKGSEGTDGREVEFRKGTTHIQWRYKGEADSAWKDLISIKELQGVAGSNGTNGTNGEDGKDGREVVFRTGETHIQWKYKNEADTAWKDLVAISTLKGADGKDSRDVQFKVGETHLQWKYADEPDTDWKNLVDVAALQGADGREVEFNVDAEKQLLQWRYKGDEAWTDLSELSIFNGADGESAYELAVKNGFVGTEAEWIDSLKGAKGDKGEQGEQGEAGKDGREVEVFVSGNQIRWRYVGEKGSYPLIDVENITGNGIKDVIVNKSESGLVTTVTVKYTKDNVEDTTFEIEDGNGIASITKTSTSLDGLVDTYTITYTNGLTTTFEVTNGATPTIEIDPDDYTWIINGIDTDIVSKGEDGEKGESAYEIAKRLGYLGSEAEWIASLKGEDGTPGKDAREVEFRMNGPQLQWRYKTDENGDPYEENEGWENLYNFGVELVQTNFVVWKGAAAPTLQIKKDANTIIDVVPATHIIAGSVDFTQGGTYPITVTYNGKMSEYDITVTTYELVETDFTLWNGDEAKLQVKVTNPDGTEDFVDPARINGTFDATLAGTYNFTVTYDGLESPAQTVTIETIRITATDLFTWKGVKPEIEIVHTNASDPIPNISNRTPDQLGITADMTVAGNFITTVTFGTDVSPELTFNVTTYELAQTDFTLWNGDEAKLQVKVTNPDMTVDTLDVDPDWIDGTFDATAADTYNFTVTYNELESPAQTVAITTLELVEDTFEIWTHWDASKMPTLSVKVDDGSSTTCLSGGDITVNGTYDLTEAGTYTVSITCMGAEPNDFVIKVTSYEIKETKFWYNQAETDLILVTKKPGEEPAETTLAYTGTITWGTVGTYPIDVTVGGLAAETINVEILGAGLYKADGTQIATWDELGIVPGNTYAAASFQTTAGSGYYALMSDTSPYKDMTGLTLVLPADATTIGNHAFRLCTNISTVILSPNTTTIGTHVFLGCTGLENITIPASVDSIGVSAFQNCSALESIVISEGVTSIGNSAFQGCTSLTSVDIPGSITSLGTKVFLGCTALKTVNLGEGLYGVAYQMFANCTSLEEITIPAGTAIMNKAFEYCTALKKITFEAWPDNMGYDTSTATSSAFYGCTERSIDIVINGNFISNSNTSSEGAWVISRQQKSIKSVTIGAGVTEIPTDALANLSIEHLIFEGTTTLGVDTSGLACKVTVNGVTTNNPYGHTIGLTSACARCGETIGAGLYDANGKLVATWEELVAAGVDVSKDYASRTDEARPMAILGTNTTLKTGTQLVLPEDVTTIGAFVFAADSATKNNTLTKVIFSPNTTKLGTGIFTYSKIKTVVIPAGVTEVPAEMFNLSTVETVIFEGIATKIGDSAFRQCKNLTTLKFGDLENYEIPHGITGFNSTDDSATSGVFNTCTQMTTIIIPTSVTKIGYRTFYSGTGTALMNLETIVYKGTMAQWNAIEKQGAGNKAWDYQLTKLKRIVCSDGVICVTSASTGGRPSYGEHTYVDGVCSNCGTAEPTP